LDKLDNSFTSRRLLTASNGNIADSKFGNDYQSMDDKLLETCVYSTFDKKNYFKQDAKFLCFFGQFSSRQETIIYNVTKYMDFTNFLQYVLKQQKINEGLNEYINDIKSGYEYITFATTMDILDNYLRNHPARRSCFSIRILYGVLLYDINKKYIEMVSSYHLSFQIEVLHEHQLQNNIFGYLLFKITLKNSRKSCGGCFSILNFFAYSTTCKIKTIFLISNKSKNLQKNDTYSFLADVNTNGENCKIKRIIVLGLK
uniref:Uncharacterized protein n=1 Tax=Strongyloides stercoralis TaxID=6248 RepID=A0AAF5DRL1_STRER